ncbi:MAG: TIGR01777 family protein [Acidimicrobiales bacterium]|nr:TIGR01777 family protein [Acidimicrobiales bacterium]
MKVLMSGASGFIGSYLKSDLESDGIEVVSLCRQKSDVVSGKSVFWDPPNKEIDIESLDKIGSIDAVVHLAGESIGNARFNSTVKEKILDSRVKTTSLLAETILKLRSRPKLFISGSAVGIYGNRGEEVLSEQSKPGTGFLAQVCQAWENSTKKCEAGGLRVVNIRTSIVLSKNGGALKRQLPIFKFGLGASLGSGSQWMSFITLQDEIRAIRFLIKNDSIFGPVNLSTNNPVTNRDFTKTLGKVLSKPAFLKVPNLGLYMAMGRELSQELLLTSQKVSPKVLTEAGFQFQAETIDQALKVALAS